MSEYLPIILIAISVVFLLVGVGLFINADARLNAAVKLNEDTITQIESARAEHRAFWGYVQDNFERSSRE